MSSSCDASLVTDVEDGERIGCSGDQRRDPAQRGLLVGEPRDVVSRPRLHCRGTGSMRSNTPGRSLSETMVGRRVVVADDDALLREGIVSLLTAAGHDVVAQADDAATLRDAVRTTVPDVVIADIRMPPTQTWEGLDAAREIRAEFPQIAILLLSAHVEVDTAIELLESGDGIGYLLKSRVAKAADLLEAVERDQRRRIGHRRGTRPRDARRPASNRPAGRADAARTRGARADGRRALQQRHRAHALGQRRRRRETRQAHPREARSPSESHDHRRVLAVLTFLEAR